MDQVQANIMLDIIIIIAMIACAVYARFWRFSKQSAIHDAMSPSTLPTIQRRIASYMVFMTVVWFVVCAFFGWRVIAFLKAVGCSGLPVYAVALAASVLAFADMVRKTYFQSILIIKGRYYS